MANGLYASFKEELLKAGIDLTSVNIKVMLIDATDYVVNLATDNTLDEVTTVAAANVALSGNFTTKTIAVGVFDADDITFSSVTGDESEGLVIFEDSGTDTTSNLIAYIDTATGLPVTPNGGDINVTWDSGANKIFAL